jgi:hypothetical protein
MTGHAAATLRALRRDLPSPVRANRMVQRNLLVYKHAWMVIVSGFFEPLFYLLGIGLGLGTLVPDIGGISYLAFVAPGLLASSCMNGAITDGFFNIFFKLHFQKVYDGILATPMRVADVALGEALWALGRGSAYAAAFLVVPGTLRSFRSYCHNCLHLFTAGGLKPTPLNDDKTR